MRSISLFLSLALVSSVSAQLRFEATHGVSGEQYQKFVDRVSKNGLRMAFVSAANDNGNVLFNAIAVENPGRHGWAARHELTLDQFQKVFTELSEKGHRLISITGYPSGKKTLFAGVWIKDGLETTWEARIGLTSGQYQDLFNRQSKEGNRPLQVVGYGTKDGHRFAAIFINDAVKEWTARHDLTDRQYQEMFDTWPAKGFSPTSLSVYPTSDGIRYAAVFIKDSRIISSQARHGLTGAQYQTFFNDATKAGLAPAETHAVSTKEGARFVGRFVKEVKGIVSRKPLPTTGKDVPSLEAIDKAMQQYMMERNITGGSLAVSHQGKLVFARGYGWRDRERKNLLGPETPFRLASVSKPITLAAILKLIREGKLKLNDRVVTLLGLKALPGQELDPRWNDITIEHLIKHQGGWDRNTSFDPMFRPLEIAKSLDRKAPASAGDVIQYMLGKPLQFDPGTKTIYSNFGYCVLGRVIEKVTGKTYTDYVREEMFLPVGIKSFHLGRSLPKDRHPLEPVYLDPNSGVNIFTGKGSVPSPDGTFHVEAMDAHGGWIASSVDVVRFLDHWGIDGQPRVKGERKNFAFFGSLPGTWTVAIQRPDGVNISALFNQRSDPSRLPYDAILKMLNQAADSVKDWPK